MKKTIFAVSDIHGEYKALLETLEKAGFDENNPNHLLISIGDAFDRGDSSLSVYQYLKRLSDNGMAIVLKGNHTSFFTGYLDGTIVSPFNYMNNGTNETMADFLHQTAPFESWCLLDKDINVPTIGDFANWLSYARQEINEEYPELLEWLKTRPYYYETKNYIFTHGGIDTNAEDWHKPHCERYHFVDWEALMWDDGSFFGKELNNTDKTVVIGHFGTARLREMYGYLTPGTLVETFPKGKREYTDEVIYAGNEVIREVVENIDDENDGLIRYSNFDEYEILDREDGRVVAIDGTSNFTKRVNVLVLENEEIINE